MQRLVQKGEKLYQEKIKKQAQEKYLGKYMMIEIDSGQYCIADASSQDLEKAEKNFQIKCFTTRELAFRQCLP